MKEFYTKIFLCLVFLHGMVKSAESANESKVTQERNDKSTYIVDPTFCEDDISAQDNAGKKNLEDVHTYAELKLDPRSTLPEAFTICSSIMRSNCYSRNYPVFFNILDNKLEQALAPYIQPSIKSRLQITFSKKSTSKIYGKTPPMFPHQWTGGCVAINRTNGSIDWVVKGNHILKAQHLIELEKLPKDLTNKLVLGATSYAGKWWAVSNKVTNLNIFSSYLSVELMKSMTVSGSCVEEGDYLAWKDMQWTLHGQAHLETLNMKEPCDGEPLVNLYNTPFLSMDSCMHHCENMGSRAPSVVTFQEWITLQDFLKVELFDRGLDSMQVWLPITDRENEGQWKDFYDGTVLQNFTPPWVGTMGGVRQNCARMTSENSWGDMRCNYPSYACMCSYNSNAYLKLRGLCPSSAIDKFYKPMNSKIDSRILTLQGLKKTLISYNNEQESWDLDVAHSSLNGTSKASHASFTLGKHNWTISGDKDCTAEKRYHTELKMSWCQEDEFTCNDGQCVNIEKRCNQLSDCRDMSDEVECQILVFDKGYNKKVPPVNSSDPVDVSISIDLLRLVNIDESDYSIEIQFEIMLKWKENRVRYNNLKRADALNALSEEDIQKLWLPEVIYENTDQKESTRLGEFGAGEWKTNMIVTREEENGLMSGLDVVDETEVFRGSENSLVMNQTYTHTFQCNFELSRYPFDLQVLDSY